MSLHRDGWASLALRLAGISFCDAAARVCSRRPVPCASGVSPTSNRSQWHTLQGPLPKRPAGRQAHLLLTLMLLLLLKPFGPLQYECLSAIPHHDGRHPATGHTLGVLSL